MRRLRVIEDADGSFRFVESDTESLWGAAAGEPIEGALNANAIRALPETPRVVLRSFRAIDDAESAFASWSNAGWESLESRVQEAIGAVGAARPGVEIVLWPSAGSVLSDGVSTLSFARKHPAVGLVIDPVAWVTSSMRADAEDHLDRFARALSLCETLAAVVVRGLDGSDGSPGIDARGVETLLGPAIGRAGVVAYA